MFDDLRFALRHLRRAPLHTAAAILTLAFAIGANTAIFSVADAVLFRPLPYAEPDRVFVLQMMNRDTGQRFTSISNDLVHAIGAYHRGVTGIATVDAGPM